MGGGIGMGNTCKPMAVSFQCMTKFTTKKKKRKRKPKGICFHCWHFSTPAHTSSWGHRGNNAVLSLQGMWEILPKRNIKANRGQQYRIVATVEMERVTRADRLKEESVGRVVKVTTPKGLCRVGYFQLKTVKAPKTWKNL